MGLQQMTDTFQRNAIRELLAKCTPEQQSFFCRIYPGGVDSVPVKSLANAYDLCERTIAKNEKVAKAALKGESE